MWGSSCKLNAPPPPPLIRVVKGRPREGKSVCRGTEGSSPAFGRITKCFLREGRLAMRQPADTHGRRFFPCGGHSGGSCSSEIPGLLLHDTKKHRQEQQWTCFPLHPRSCRCPAGPGRLVRDHWPTLRLTHLAHIPGSRSWKQILQISRCCHAGVAVGPSRAVVAFIRSESVRHV